MQTNNEIEIGKTSDNVELWLRVTTTGDYLQMDYLDKNETFEYLMEYMEG